MLTVTVVLKDEPTTMPAGGGVALTSRLTNPASGATGKEWQPVISDGVQSALPGSSETQTSTVPARVLV